jgi:hypothetical protein
MDQPAADSEHSPDVDLNLPIETSGTWYFVPYTEAEEYTPGDPLYALVGVFEEFGAVKVYDRPGEAGAFHSIDPTEIEEDSYPPSDAFQTALTVVLSSPGETQDITNLVEEMYPWEHHQLEILLTGLNQSPELLPDEVTVFINDMMEEQLSIKVDDEADTTEFGAIVSEEGERFLDDIL